MATLGERLKHERNKRGWTQEYVASRLGLKGHSTYSNWEYDNRKPDPDMLFKLAELYEVSTDYLISGTKSGSSSDADIDPEWVELFEEVKKAGAELEAGALLRSVAEGKVSKNVLRDLLRAYNIIKRDDE